MAQLGPTPASMRRIRRWTIALAALASLLIAASASAATQDLRSPDARAGAAAVTPPPTQDLRSPDARAGAVVPVEPAGQDLRSPDASNAAAPLTPSPVPQDLRSPDARQAGGFVAAPQDATGSSGGSAWIYLALAGLASLATIGVLLVQRHRRHPVATG
jgi:hypothetical protein